YLYQGSKPVHWCVDCGSALAEAEVEYEDVNSPAIHVAFKAKDNDLVAQSFGLQKIDGEVFAVIWTTTPWTLPANQAVSVNADVEYNLVRTEKGFVIVAKELAYDLAIKCGLDDTLAVATCKGEALKGLLILHPFDNRKVP
ncbi:MAG TPA: isoleucine--tRNA ligase, partial [Methylophilaceae bacterium]|nr:isoleucine--tRNA ligase [Methylophilaceae bacterium]